MGTAIGRHGPWALVGALGAAALAIVASQRGETINALWIVVAAVCVYLIAYRYYSQFIADKVMRLDPKRATPAVGEVAGHRAAHHAETQECDLRHCALLNIRRIAPARSRTTAQRPAATAGVRPPRLSAAFTTTATTMFTASASSPV